MDVSRAFLSLRFLSSGLRELNSFPESFTGVQMLQWHSSTNIFDRWFLAMTQHNLFDYFLSLALVFQAWIKTEPNFDIYCEYFPIIKKRGQKQQCLRNTHQCFFFFHKLVRISPKEKKRISKISKKSVYALIYLARQSTGSSCPTSTSLENVQTSHV